MHAEEILDCRLHNSCFHTPTCRTLANFGPQTSNLELFPRSVKKTLSLNGRFCRFKDFLMKILCELESFNRLQVVDLRLATTPETKANYE